MPDNDDFFDKINLKESAKDATPTCPSAPCLWQIPPPKLEYVPHADVFKCPDCGMTYSPDLLESMLYGWI